MFHVVSTFLFVIYSIAASEIAAELLLQCLATLKQDMQQEWLVFGRCRWDVAGTGCEINLISISCHTLAWVALTILFLKTSFLKWDDKRDCKELQKLWASQIDV